MILRNCDIFLPKIVRFITERYKNHGVVMNTDEIDEIELNVPESCPKCGKGAFYRMSDEGP